MREPSLPLTALSEAQRAQALKRFTIIRPALEEGITQAQVARTHQIAPSTVQLWIKRYREKGRRLKIVHFLKQQTISKFDPSSKSCNVIFKRLYV